MTKRLVILATAFTFGLSAIAQAGPATKANEAKGSGYRTAKYSGGEGATWKTGRDTHGFSGSYGGCQYTGHAGPNGYKIDRVC